MYIKFTRKPQPNQILSDRDKSMIGANDDPLFRTHECFTIFTDLSLPDQTTATAAECKVLSPLKVLSDCAKYG